MRGRGTRPDPPTVARGTQIGMRQATDQPAWHPCRLGPQSQPLGRGEIQNCRISPDLTNHATKAAAAQPVLHRPEHIGGARDIDHDDRTQRAYPRNAGISAFLARYAILHPQDWPLTTRQPRQRKAEAAASATVSTNTSDKVKQDNPG